MDMILGMTLLAVVVLLILSAFFSCSETALTATSRARMYALEQEGNVHAALVNRMLETPERIISTVLLGNNLVNILAASLTTSLMIGFFGDAGVFYATGITTVLVVIFCEVLPKTYAIAFPDRIALAVSPVMRFLITALSPFTTAAQWIVRRLLKLTPTKLDDEANILDPHGELRGTIDLHHKEGTVEKSDRDMLGGILDLEELSISDVMIHRTKMETINIDDSIEKIVDAVMKSQFTRLPVWQGDAENIIGVINSKNLVRALQAADWQREKLDLHALMSNPWFVPETTSLRDQLTAFLRRKEHVALVIDEYGVVQGLLTLEDILEEIVGQIADEHDIEGPGFRLQTDGSVVAEGATPIRDLNRQLDWSLPDEEATTIAGLVIHEAQTIPEAGQAFTFHGYRFEILRKNRNRLILLRIRPPLPSTNDTSGQTRTSTVD